MKEYTIYFEESYKVNIEAKSSDEARDKFLDGLYDNPKYLEITNIDVIEQL